MGGSATKFEFATEFGSDGSIISQDDSWRQTVPRAEVEGLVQQARTEGAQAADTQATQSLQQVCEILTGQMQTLLAQCGAVSKQMREEAAQFSLIVANKLAGAALANFEQAQLQDIISRTLSELKGTPAIQVTVPETAAGPLSEAMKDLVADSEFGGSIRIYGDTEAHAGSVTLEWQEGMVRFDPAEVEERVRAEVENWLASRTQQDEQTSLQQGREQEHG